MRDDSVIPENDPRPESHRHHVVPAFYLAAFTDTGFRDGFVTVTDLDRRTTYRGRPDSVAFRNNYNTFQTAGVDPDGLERSFGEVERRAAPVIRRVLETSAAPSGDGLHALLMLLAIQAARSPNHRASIAKFTAEVAQRMLEVMTSTPEIFESHAKRLKREGIDLGDYQEMRDFVRRSEVRVGDNDWLKAMSLEALDEVADTMMGRSWRLFAIPEGSEFTFVTSDHPLNLRWSDGRPSRGLYPPGFGLRRTRVTFPVGPRALLSGEFEGPAGRTSTANERQTALLNSNTILGSVQVYSASEDFVWADGEAVCRGSESLLRACSDRSDSGT